MTLSPEFTSAFRFLVWATALGTAIVVGHFAVKNREIRVPAIGVVIEALSWATHQYYYWLRWMASGDASIRPEWYTSGPWIPTVALVGASVGAVMVMSPYFEMVAGRYWPILGAAALSALLAIGYGVAVTW